MLITGPAGVGKEVAARLLHNWSPRANGAVHRRHRRADDARAGRGGIVRQRRRAASWSRPGLLEQAHGGTLFLDEIADMPLTTQGKILRVLTDQSFTRVGGQRTVKVDMRVVSSTARNLPEEIAAGRFREDLYYRLNVVPVHLPALAERREDIPELVDHFVARYAADSGVPTPSVSDDAMAALQAYDWPGNVRQLRNVDRAHDHPRAGRADRLHRDRHAAARNPQRPGAADPERGGQGDHGHAAREARETFEREYLRVQIRRFSGNISRTANFIGMERSALHRKLKALGIADTRGEGSE